MEKINKKSFNTNDPPIWIRGSNDTCYCSSVCISRNLEGFVFPNKISLSDSRKVISKIFGKINQEDFFKNFKYCLINDLDFETKGRIYERRISFSTINEGLEEIESVLVVNEDETIVITINSNDHLQVKVSCPGFDIRSCLNKANEVLSKIDLDFVNKNPFGYLTSSPAIMGTGIQIEAFAHLPASIVFSENKDYNFFINDNELLTAGFWSFASETMGNSFTFCNKNTNRKTDSESVSLFEKSFSKIIDFEMERRSQIDLSDLKDFVFRTYGTLKYVQIIDVNEALSLLSILKFGVSKNVIDLVDYKTILNLMFKIMPAQMCFSKKFEPDLEDNVRADIIRKTLSRKVKSDVINS